MRHYLIERFGKENVSDCILGHRLNDALVLFGHLNVISGHFFLQQGDELPLNRLCITVLRDPIDRFLSDYSFSKGDCADRLLNTKLHALEFDAYLEQLAQDPLNLPAAQVEMLYPLGTSSQSQLSPGEKLRSAVQAIDLFNLVGIQEELEDLAYMLDAELGGGHTPLRLKNATAQRIEVDSLSPWQLKKIRSLLAHEFELYQHAKSRFQALRREFLTHSVKVSENSSAKVSVDILAAIERPLPEQSREFGDERCTIEEATVNGEISGSNLVMIGERFHIVVKINAHEYIETLNAGIAIKDERGMLVFGTNTMLLGDSYSLSQGEYTISFSMLNRMRKGNYSVDVALIRSESHYEGCYHWREKVTSFKVHDSAVTHYEGSILMDANVSFAARTDESIYEHKPYVAAGNQVKSFGRLNAPLHQFESIIRPVAHMDGLFPGTEVFVPLRVENISQETWVAYGQQPVTLTYRWLTDDGEIVVADGIRTRLPSDILPGEGVIIPLRVSVPKECQSLQLVISLVQEAVAWFVDRNPQSAFITSIDFV